MKFPSVYHAVSDYNLVNRLVRSVKRHIVSRATKLTVYVIRGLLKSTSDYQISSKN